VLISAAANLAGAFVTTAVATTVGKGLIDTGLATEQTVLAALFGAITWNLLTWRAGLPIKPPMSACVELDGRPARQASSGPECGTRSSFPVRSRP